MFVADLLIASISALCIVWIVSITFGTKGPWDNLLWFFLVVALFGWACGVWLVPFGPHWRGISGLPIICMGIWIALLLVAASPRTSRQRPMGHEKTLAHHDNAVAIDILVWLVILCLVIMGVGHYAWYLRPN